MSLLSWYNLISGPKSGKGAKNGKKKTSKPQSVDSLINYNLFKLAALVVALVPLTLILLGGQRSTPIDTSESQALSGNGSYEDYEERYYHFLATTEQHYPEIR